MIRMASKKQPLKQFHKDERKPRRTAFNLIRYFCKDCDGRMVANGTADRLTSFKCDGCGRTKKLSRGENPEVRI